MDSAQIVELKDDLLWGARRSARYHSRRRDFFDNYRLFTSAISALFGSAAIATAISTAGKGWTIAAGAVVTFFSVLDLVVGSARMARLHEDLYRQFVVLEKEIISTPETGWTEEWARSLTARRLEIEADEPPIKRVLDSLVYNELARATGFDSSQFIRIAWYQRLLAQFLDIRQHSLRRDTDSQTA